MRWVLLVVVLAAAVGCKKKPAATDNVDPPKIAERPAAPMRNAAGEPKGGSDKSPGPGEEPAAAEFNPKDGAETTRWLARRAWLARTSGNKGSDVADWTKSPLFKETVSSLVGREISLLTKVRVVAENWYLDSDLGYHWPDKVMMNTGWHTNLSFTPIRNDPQWFPRKAWAGSDDQFKALRPGSPVRVSGTIAEVKCDSSTTTANTRPPSTFGMDQWTFSIKDMTYSPIE